jgi:hypothetical protein
MHDDPPTCLTPVAADPARRRWLRSVGAVGAAVVWPLGALARSRV